MAITLKVSAEQLESAANAFDASRGKCVDYARRIMNIADDLQGSWQGDAAASFRRQFQGIQNDIQKIDKIINEHVQDLRDIAGVYKRTEETVRGQSSGLHSSVLSY